MIMKKLSAVTSVIKEHFQQWLLISIVFTLLYYLVLMLSLIIRFQDLPNYFNLYDWVGNINTIIKSTPSLKDTILIIKDEWLMEIGFMNYDFGIGISEWSLFIAPAKVLGVFLLGALLATNYFLIKKIKDNCSMTRLRSTKTTAGFGAVLVSLASITMSWVVCCSTPTWVVGLAMMGLGVSTSLWLEPLGLVVSSLGFVLLLLAVFLAAGNVSKQSSLTVANGDS